jgi:hypothetical protein
VNNSTLISTFFLTLLLIVGLVFFIRASVKDRTETIKLVVTEPIEVLLDKLQKYFEQRAYQLIDVDKSANKLVFQGFVQPSWFLAVFLSALAGIGLFCLALVLNLLIPTVGQLFFSIVLLAPLAGVFYWQKSGRLESVLLKIEQQQTTNDKQAIAIVAHRDELAQIQQAFSSQQFIYDR